MALISIGFSEIHRIGSIEKASRFSVIGKEGSKRLRTSGRSRAASISEIQVAAVDFVVWGAVETGRMGGAGLGGRFETVEPKAGLRGEAAEEGGDGIAGERGG